MANPGAANFPAERPAGKFAAPAPRAYHCRASPAGVSR